VILGDNNFPGINWMTLGSDSHGQDFLDLVQDCFLSQHVVSPTRGSNILDLVLLSEENMIEDLVVKEQLANSDHNIVNFKLRYKTGNSKRGIVNKYNFSKADYCAMNDFLLSIDCICAFDRLDANSMWCMFCDKLNDTVRRFVPQSRNKKFKYPKWMSRRARGCRKYKSAMWKRYQSTQDYNDWIEDKRALNKATSEYKKAKKVLKRN